MAVAHRLRLRRSAAQLHALVRVEREIRAADTFPRRKYLREFSDAYRSYERVLSDHEFHEQLLGADVILLGDYHALAKSQQYAAELVETLATITGRPVIMGLEPVFACDQAALDAWKRGEIGEQDLREKIRFDDEWGYEWKPFYNMLAMARLHAAEIVGLDCMPRGDLRRIGARDRHAAAAIADAHQRNPESIQVVLFGESHLAPNHLPALVKAALPERRVLTLLQNIDALYWKAAGERESVRAVQVSSNVLCVFNSTPLEKYESYRLCIERWRGNPGGSIDLAPTFFNLVEALTRFLGLEEGRFGELPHVCSRASAAEVRRLMERKSVPELELREVMSRLFKKGIAYCSFLNTVFAVSFQIQDAADEAARFVNAVLRRTDPPHAELALGDDDRFYRRVIAEALAYFGSRVLYPARKAVREADLYTVYGKTREELQEQEIYSYREYMETIDFLVMHRDYESNLRQYWERPELLQQGLNFTGERFEFATRTLGQLLGSDLYDAYVAGLLSRRSLRSLFSRDFSDPGEARTAYFVTARRLRRRRMPRRRLAA